MNNNNPLIKLPSMNLSKVNDAMSSNYYDLIFDKLSQAETLCVQTEKYIRTTDFLRLYGVDSPSFESISESLGDIDTHGTTDEVIDELDKAKMNNNKEVKRLCKDVYTHISVNDYLTSIVEKHKRLDDAIRKSNHLLNGVSEYKLNNTVVTGYSPATYIKYLNACAIIRVRAVRGQHESAIFSSINIPYRYGHELAALGIQIKDEQINKNRVDLSSTESFTSLGWNNNYIQSVYPLLLFDINDPFSMYDVIEGVKQNLDRRLDDGTDFDANTYKGIQDTLLLIKTYDETMTKLKEQVLDIV